MEIEDGQDGIDEGGDGSDGEEELAPPDWHVRAGPSNRPTQQEREEHEATHVRVRNWCIHRTTGTGRTHHHATKQKSEDQPRRATIAIDYYSMKK